MNATCNASLFLILAIDAVFYHADASIGDDDAPIGYVLVSIGYYDDAIGVQNAPVGDL